MFSPLGNFEKNGCPGWPVQKKVFCYPSLKNLVVSCKGNLLVALLPHRWVDTRKQLLVPHNELLDIQKSED